MIMYKNRHSPIFRVILVGTGCLFLFDSACPQTSYAIPVYKNLATNCEIHGPLENEVVAQFIVRAIRQLRDAGTDNRNIPARLRELMEESPIARSVVDINPVGDGLFRIVLLSGEIFFVNEKNEIMTDHPDYNHVTHEITQDEQIANATHINLTKRARELVENIAAELERAVPGLGDKILQLLYDEHRELRKQESFDRTLIGFVDGIQGFYGHAGKQGIHIDARYMDEDYRDGLGRGLKEILRHEILAYLFPYTHSEIASIEADLQHNRDKIQLAKIKEVERRLPDEPRDWDMAKEEDSGESSRDITKTFTPDAELVQRLRIELIAEASAENLSRTRKFLEVVYLIRELEKIIDEGSLDAVQRAQELRERLAENVEHPFPTHVSETRNFLVTIDIIRRLSAIEHEDTLQAEGIYTWHTRQAKILRQRLEENIENPSPDDLREASTFLEAAAVIKQLDSIISDGSLFFGKLRTPRAKTASEIRESLIREPSPYNTKAAVYFIEMVSLIKQLEQVIKENSRLIQIRPTPTAKKAEELRVKLATEPNITVEDLEEARNFLEAVSLIKQLDQVINEGRLDTGTLTPKAQETQELREKLAENIEVPPADDVTAAKNFLETALLIKRLNEMIDIEAVTSLINRIGDDIWDKFFASTLVEDLKNVEAILPVILDLDFLPEGVQRQALEGTEVERSEILKLIERNIHRRLRLAGSRATCKIEVSLGEDKEALLARAGKYQGKAILITTDDKVRAMTEEEVRGRVKDITAITPRTRSEDGRQPYAHAQAVIAYAAIKSMLTEDDFTDRENSPRLQALLRLHLVLTEEPLALDRLSPDILYDSTKSAIELLIGEPAATTLFDSDELRRLQRAEEARLRAA